MAADQQPFAEHISYIEDLLARYYGFSLQLSATDYLLKKPIDGLNIDYSLPGQMIVLNGSEQSDVGLFFHPNIVDTICSNPPLSRLADANLNAWCVLVEEISHFHFFINRALKERETSRLELEWQAEIDKILIAGFLLLRQVEASHVDALVRKVFDSAVIFANEADLYWQSSRSAARFWHSALRHSSHSDKLLQSKELRSILRTAYWSEWNIKKDLLVTSTLDLHHDQHFAKVS